MVDKEGQLPRGDRLGTYMDALRNLARSDLPDRVKLIEKNIDLYLEGGQGIVRLRTCAQLSIMKRVNGVRARSGASPGNTFTRCCSKLNPRMLPDHEYPFLSVNRCSG
jgi:hypothetical protein